MLNEGQKFIDDLRSILKKYNLSNTEIRILWEESDAFVSNFMAGKTKTLNFNKLISLVRNVKSKQLFELHLEICQLVLKALNLNALNLKALIRVILESGENTRNED